MRINYKLLHSILVYLNENPTINDTAQIQEALSLNESVATEAYEVLAYEGFIDDFRIEDGYHPFIIINLKGKRFLLAGGYLEIYKGKISL